MPFKWHLNRGQMLSHCLFIVIILIILRVVFVEGLLHLFLSFFVLATFFTSADIASDTWMCNFSIGLRNNPLNVEASQVLLWRHDWSCLHWSQLNNRWRRKFRQSRLLFLWHNLFLTFHYNVFDFSWSRHLITLLSFCCLGSSGCILNGWSSLRLYACKTLW